LIFVVCSSLATASVKRFVLAAATFASASVTRASASSAGVSRAGVVVTLSTLSMMRSICGFSTYFSRSRP
jgi:hypothetical protein